MLCYEKFFIAFDDKLFSFVVLQILKSIKDLKISLLLPMS